MSEYAELKARLDELETRLEIEKLILNYGKAADASESEEGYKLFVSLFSEDCVYTNAKFGFVLKGNGDNPPVFDKDDPKKLITPGGIGWLYRTVMMPTQEEYFSLIGNITIEINGDEATGADHMIRAGYRKPKTPDTTPKDLQYTYALHKFKFKKINNQWKIVWFEGNPLHTTAVIK